MMTGSELQEAYDPKISDDSNAWHSKNAGCHYLVCRVGRSLLEGDDPGA